MNKALLPLLLLLSVLQSVSHAEAQKSSTQTYLDQLHQQGQERVVVFFEQEADPALLEKYDVRLIHNLKSIKALVCVIEQENIQLLKQEEGVRDVVPDMVVEGPPVPEPEREKGGIGALSYDGPVTVRWNNLPAGLNSKAAWDGYDLDGAGVKIAVIDTGVNYTMENLDDNYLGGWDFVNHDDDPINPNQDEIHGTEIVSLAIGEGVNKVVGVAYNSGYYAVRVVEGPNPPTGLLGDLIAAIAWASTEPHKADIISLSVGTDGDVPFWESVWKPSLQQVCDDAHDRGTVVVAASGNDGSGESFWPAAFDNVISVGAHGEDQTIWNDHRGGSNGGVDVVTPAARVYTVHPDNSAWWVWGTSFAAPHASALLALQLQYTRQNSIEANNGYHWEIMKHSAIDLGIDPTYQGKGKIYAAQTDSNDPNLGSIDLIASNWPIDYSIEFSDYAFYDSDYPTYHIGSDVNQTITLTNITDILGNTVETIENLTVSAQQFYCNEPNEPNLPGASRTIFPTISEFYPADGNSLTLNLSYTIPEHTTPGLAQTRIAFEFNFVGNSRIIKVSYPAHNSQWYCAIPGDLNLSNRVDMTDWSIFARSWRQAGCAEPDYCARADIDTSGDVDWSDVSRLAANWLGAVE